MRIKFFSLMNTWVPKEWCFFTHGYSIHQNMGFLIWFLTGFIFMNETLFNVFH